jgi:hypothetical protein
MDSGRWAKAAERVGLPSYEAQADAAVSAGATAAEIVNVLVGVVRIVGRAIGHDLGADGGRTVSRQNCGKRGPRGLRLISRLDSSGLSLSKRGCVGCAFVLAPEGEHVAPSSVGDQVSPEVKWSGR